MNMVFNINKKNFVVRFFILNIVSLFFNKNLNKII